MHKFWSAFPTAFSFFHFAQTYFVSIMGQKLFLALLIQNNEELKGNKGL